jgi:hypothetical protein
VQGDEPEVVHRKHLLPS